jgi:hypothetical protein
MPQSRSLCCRWVGALSLATLCAVACPPAAYAQQVMLSQPGATVTYDVHAGAVTWAVADALAPYGAIYTADGRFAVAGITGAVPSVRLIDAATGAFADVAVSFDARVAHPRDHAVYGLADGALFGARMAKGNPARLDGLGITRYPGCATGTTSAIDLSGDGTRLFAGCESGDLAVIDAVTGALLHTLTPGPVTFKSTYDGSALVVVVPAVDAPIDLIDANTGTLLHRMARPGTTPCTPSIAHVSPDRRLGIVSCSIFTPPVPRSSSTAIAIDALGLAPGPTLHGLDLRIASISPDNRTAYSTAFVPRIGPGSILLTDLTTGVTTMALGGFNGSIAVNHAPLAPLPIAQVVGRRVDLAWTQPPGSPLPTSYVLEIGTARGRSDLGTIEIGPRMSLSVPGVPPGSYCVRIRARNVAGISAASNEMFIDVP